ncbi:hypothetical protein QUB75_28230 [Microcoleus sp. K1-B6]|uniref:hypothetical protein n=1 Tax=unclassified Microcoleus TaxID=2642155 RepID=UPI002FD15BE8
MQYKKQRKTSWWLILLFIPLLVGCNPVTTELFLKLEAYVGDALLGTVVGPTIEIIFDQVISYISPHTKPYPDNPLRGRYTGDFTFKKEDPNCKDVHTEKQPEMVRKSIKDQWQPVPAVKDRTKQFFENHC